MKRYRLKRKVVRFLNRTRRVLSCSLGAAAFLFLYTSHRLPLQPDLVTFSSSEYTLEELEKVSYQNMVDRSSQYTHVMPVFAHRGYSSLEADNSLASFQKAVQAGVPQIEIDVRCSSDGILYVSHDNSLKESCGSSLSIASSSSQKLSTVKLKNGEPLPTLQDLFDAFGGSVMYLVEIKNGTEDVESFLECMESNEDLLKNVYVQAWDLETLDCIAQKYPGMFRQLLMPDLSLLPAALESENVNSLAIQKDFISRDLVNQIHQANKKCWAWTINEPKDIQSMRNMGVDGIVSDNPDTALANFQG